ncbi:hypothetical protein N7491_005794 [Penicillium cf. griseofulvum]|uniref:Uncharacterized protein n=1 Tax=Penicillium cf. griseofulvum TaxID=2972120 RepID=A0A9W9J2K8_9EURO|nr:hypothetical protein N7472_008477 [Penicillium cf. griseofulvum]KAJ5435199.1 hypothetical protein N7491_005794 [Penicillium cf. griseofulvum]KAJ5453031.1 hypothetical protein N7445_001214 [Penicillium cf. griseofulvum]
MSQSHPPYTTLHSQSESDLEFVEYLASHMSVHRHGSETEMGVSEIDSTVHTHPQTDEKKRPFNWSGSWAWEIGAVALAVVGLVLLVAFLVKINNTPYATWQYTASPNTVVSIIITITKSAVLVSVSACLGQLKWDLFQNPAPLYHMQVIDEASRGPWGSLEVLLRGIFGSKTGSLTYVGAFLTILALAVDPFAQQILTFPSRTVVALNATAFIQTSQLWYSIGDSDASDVFLELQPTLLAPIMSGLLQTHRPLEPQCNASSCEFPEFVALGMCSECEDVTSRTNQKCQVPEYSDFWDDIHPVFRKTPTNCSYQSPNNFSFDFDGFMSMDYEYENITFHMHHWSSRPRKSNPILDIQTPIFSLIEVDYTNPVSYTISNATAPPTKPLITECAIYFCERKYSASSYLPETRNSHPIHIVDTQQLVATNVREESPYYFSTDSVHLAPPNGSTTLSKNASYSIDHQTFNTFEPTMMRLFNSTAVFSSNVSTSDILNLATILRKGNLSQLLDLMSTSVTDTLRANPHGTKIPGKAFRVETFIHVRWPWIILPVIVTLGSIALLLGTAIGSKHRNAVLWKCMVLPLLSSHLQTENEIASVRSVDGLTDQSKKTRAVMVQDEGPLTFREQ